MIVFTGAFSVGKTTTLEHLAGGLGFTPDREAHRQVLARLGSRTHGHPPHAPFTRIDAGGHLCPMCCPEAFCDQVLALQREIEAGHPPFVDRGQIDPLELRSRRTSEPLDALLASLELPYTQAFVFEVIFKTSSSMSVARPSGLSRILSVDLRLTSLR